MAAPITTFTRVKLLSAQRGTAVIVGTSVGRLRIVSLPSIRVPFPYTFPIDLTEHTPGRVYSGGRVKLLAGGSSS